jgi:hypothetical protein
VIAQAKQVALRSKHVVIAVNLYNNWRARRANHGREFDSSDGSTHDRCTAAASLGYIEQHLQDYERYGGVTAASLQGKRVLEIGPGDNVGAALHLLASGAAHVVCVDKYYIRHDTEKERRIYLALRERLSLKERRRFDEAVALDDGIKLNPDRIQCIYRTGIEEAGDVLHGMRFDLIVSRGVLQYLEPERAFRVMDALLLPGGMMLHKIPFDDLGMFSKNGMNPLTFLTIPSSTYRRMTSDVTRPNRRLFDYYREKMDAMGYQARYYVTCVVGEPGELVPHREQLQAGRDYPVELPEQIEAFRGRLAPEFRKLSTADLMVGGIFLIARKAAL